MSDVDQMYFDLMQIDCNSLDYQIKLITLGNKTLHSITEMARRLGKSPDWVSRRLELNHIRE